MLNTTTTCSSCGCFLFLVQGPSALVCLTCDSPAQLRRDAAQAPNPEDRAILLSVADRDWEREMEREQQWALEPVEEGPGDCPSCLRPRVAGHHGCYCGD